MKVAAPLSVLAALLLGGCLMLSGDAAFRGGDLGQAADIWSAAAARGDGAAALKMGFLHANYEVATAGESTPAWWFERACELGNAEGCHEAGLAHERGEGVKRDPRRAFAFFQMAARRGFLRSQYRLAGFYANEAAAADSAFDGYKWILIARENADAGWDSEELRQQVLADTDGYLARLERRLSPEERRRAVAEKKSFRPEK